MGEVILKARNIFKSYDNGEKTLSVLNDLSIHILARTLPKISGKYFFTSYLFFSIKSLSTNSKA